MKKIFVILMIASVLTACNNSSKETTTTATDSATDSATAAESPLMDAVSTADSASRIIQDSSIKIMDTLPK